MSDAPVATARSITAASTSSPPTVSVHWTSAARPRRPSVAAAGRAAPRTLAALGTSCPGASSGIAQCVERGDLVEQDCGSVDIGLDAGGLLVTDERLEHLGDGRFTGEPCDGGPHRGLEDAEVARVAGEVERERRRVPDIAGSAPPARVVAVGELELDRPRRFRVVEIVGQCQPQACRDQRGAGGTSAQPVERDGDVAERNSCPLGGE